MAKPKPKTKLADKDVPAKERLLKTGAALFSEKGFGGVSVREICKHANTSMNMIHHYFGSKEKLLEAIVDQFGSDVFAIPMRLLESVPKSKEDFESRIEMLFETTLEAYIAQRDVLLLVIREQADPVGLTEFVSKYADFLEVGKKKGFVRKALDTQMVTGFMLDRILNQVQFAPWIKQVHGVELLTDSKYKKRWCKSNLDLIFNGLLT
jgi:AcrR family transcriptional regulator